MGRGCGVGGALGLVLCLAMGATGCVDSKTPVSAKAKSIASAPRGVCTLLDQAVASRLVGEDYDLASWSHDGSSGQAFCSYRDDTVSDQEPLSIASRNATRSPRAALRVWPFKAASISAVDIPGAGTAYVADELPASQVYGRVPPNRYISQGVVNVDGAQLSVHYGSDTSSAAARTTTVRVLTAVIDALD